jgi:hypothetical protein
VSVVAQEPPAPVVVAAAIPAPPAVSSDAPVIAADPVVRDAPAIPQSTAAPADSAGVALSVLWLGLLPSVIYMVRIFWGIPRDALSASGQIAIPHILYLLSVVLYWRRRGWRLPMVAVAIPIIGVFSALLALSGPNRDTAIVIAAVQYVAIGGILSGWAFMEAGRIPSHLIGTIALSALWLMLILRLLAFAGLFDVRLSIALSALLGGVAFFSIRRFGR